MAEPVTIRNLDHEAYRRLKAQAALEGRTVGELLTDAINAYTRQVSPARRGRPAAGREPPAISKRHAETKAASFARPPPKWGPLKDNPLVVVEVAGQD